MSTKESFNVGQGYGSCLVNHYKVRVANLISIIGEDELYELIMAFKDIYSEDSSIVLFVIAIYLLEILPLLVLQ